MVRPPQAMQPVEIEGTEYLSPFTTFAMPRERELLHLWWQHFDRLGIGIRVVGSHNQRELVINKEDHLRELRRKL